MLEKFSITGVSQCAKHEDLTKQRRTSHYQKHIRWDNVDPDKSRLNALNSVHVGHQHAADGRQITQSTKLMSNILLSVGCNTC